MLDSVIAARIFNGQTPNEQESEPFMAALDQGALIKDSPVGLVPSAGAYTTALEALSEAHVVTGSLPRPTLAMVLEVLLDPLDHGVVHHDGDLHTLRERGREVLLCQVKRRRS
jgi:hypothetical protein